MRPCGHRALGFNVISPPAPSTRHRRHLVRQGPASIAAATLFRHANAAGSAENGGVLWSAGDEPWRKILHRAASVRPCLILRPDAYLYLSITK